jgi:predicted pyridoxine 5'-phosphate oxidase superfamily flavin-nucleotide-binding protein
MHIPEICKKYLTAAEGKALATCGDGGVSVVPVSSLKLKDEKIILVNYFFNQSLTNIEQNPKVALAAWVGLEGCRVEAAAEHLTEGEIFDEVVVWIKQTLPERVVKGVLVLSPTAFYNISAGPEAGSLIEG